MALSGHRVATAECALSEQSGRTVAGQIQRLFAADIPAGSVTWYRMPPKLIMELIIDMSATGHKISI